MAHTPQSLDELVAAQRYIHAKLRKFELDQVTRPFAATAQQQGLGRAMRGTLQRVALKSTTLYDKYVARTAGQIEGERQLVAAFEREHGESFARDLYHRIRDAPEEDIPTYKVSRAVFRKLERDLALERAKTSKNPITKAWRHAKAWVTYGDRELKAAAIAAGVLLGTTIMVPVHRINEWNDHHRSVQYVKFERDAHPIVASAISARNLQMYLNEMYNRASRIEGARTSFAQEYWDFIDCQTCDETNPLSEPQTYNLRFTHNDAGNDWTRPWAFLHRENIHRATQQLKPSDAPVGTVRNGRTAVNGSWDYFETDEGGHQECHEVCTTDANGNESCHTECHYVCDWRSWQFRLDKPRLMRGVETVTAGTEAFPFEQLPVANPAPYLASPKEIVLGGNLNPKRLARELEFRNAWAQSKLIEGYNGMIGGAQSLAHGDLLPKMRREMGQYRAVFDDLRASCSGPDNYPHGWNDHRRLIGASDAVIGPHALAHDTLKQYATFVPAIRKHIATIGDGASTHDQVRDAVIGLGDLGWQLSNVSGFDGWHPSHAMRLFLEWLGFLGIGAAAGFGGYALLDKYRDSRLVRKLHENDIEPELVDPWPRYGRRY